MNNISCVSARCRYYKSGPANAILDHADSKRNGTTQSKNVFKQFTKNNAGFYYHNASSCADALELMRLKHKEVKGKKIRVDNNILFEHIICLSEYQYAALESKFSPERVKKATISKLKLYGEAVKNEWGFEILGIDLHLDEGRFEACNLKEAEFTGEGNAKKIELTASDSLNSEKFVRNIHAHVQFINFDFSKGVAPLKGLFIKGKDESGKTNQLNPHFERIQDIAFETFKSWGFKRGQSKSITNKVHLNKEDFVKNKILELKKQAVNLGKDNKCLSIVVDKKRAEVEVVKSDMHAIGEKMIQLRNQVNELNSLRAELSKAIQQRSEVALQHVITKARAVDSTIKVRRY